MINQGTGVMEIKTDTEYIVNKFIHQLKAGKKILVGYIETSKHHAGRPMLVLKEEEPDGVSIYYLEISSVGIFAYIFDDSVS